MEKKKISVETSIFCESPKSGKISKEINMTGSQVQLDTTSLEPQLF